MEEKEREGWTVGVTVRNDRCYRLSYGCSFIVYIPFFFFFFGSQGYGSFSLPLGCSLSPFIKKQQHAWKVVWVRLQVRIPNCTVQWLSQKHEARTRNFGEHHNRRKVMKAKLCTYRRRIDGIRPNSTNNTTNKHTIVRVAKVKQKMLHKAPGLGAPSFFYYQYLLPIFGQPPHFPYFLSLLVACSSYSLLLFSLFAYPPRFLLHCMADLWLLV